MVLVRLICEYIINHSGFGGGDKYIHLKDIMPNALADIDGKTFPIRSMDEAMDLLKEVLGDI